MDIQCHRNLMIIFTAWHSSPPHTHIIQQIIASVVVMVISFYYTSRRYFNFYARYYMLHDGIGERCISGSFSTVFCGVFVYPTLVCLVDFYQYHFDGGSVDTRVFIIDYYLSFEWVFWVWSLTGG